MFLFVNCIATHTLYKLISKRVIPLKCKRCGNEWEYAGSNTYFANCSHCRTSVNIKKQMVNSDGSQVPASPSSTKELALFLKKIATRFFEKIDYSALTLTIL